MVRAQSWDQPSADVSSQPRMGLTLATRYLLERQVRGPLWEAIDTTLSRPVYIEVLDPRSARSGRVLAAARIAASYNDPRFSRVLDAYSAAGQESFSFVVCEKTPGSVLSRLLQQSPLTNSEAAFVVREVADALIAPHSKGLFDQYLTPDRIAVTDIGGVKIFGFLLDAAFDGVDQQGSVAKREDRDIRMLGALLYACTTGMWPKISLLASQIPDLENAPVDNTIDGAKLIPPRQIRTGVHPGLSQLALLLLTDGNSHPKYGSAQAVANVLTHLLGNTEPWEDLEGRLRRQPPDGEPNWASAATSVIAEPIVSAKTVTITNTAASASDAPTVAFNPAGHDQRFPKDQSATKQMPALSEPSNEPTTLNADLLQRFPANNEPTQAFNEQLAAEDSAIPAEDLAGVSRETAAPKIPTANPRRRVADRRVRLYGLLSALVASCIVIALVVFGLGHNSPDDLTPEESSQPSAAGPLTIANITDFDPSADGGDDDERADLVGLILDGDPATCWTTWNYYGNPNFGNLKPGAGVLIDLGQPHNVSSVTLNLETAPADLQLMIPIGDPNADLAPTDSVDQWTSIANAVDSQSETVLSPQAVVNTRWLLVYFTKLPAVDDSSFRSGICSLEVHG